MFNVESANSPIHLQKILSLRNEILRAPWSQPADTATDDREWDSVNAFIKNENEEVVACGRLQVNENSIGQIRFMAVNEKYQGQGLGKLIVKYLEQEAEKHHLQKIQLQARENAVPFYERAGYKIKEKSFLLWDQIQHYLMEKVL